MRLSTSCVEWTHRKLRAISLYVVFLIDTQACDVFGGDPEDSYPLIPGTYMALYYKSITGDPYPFFERICESIMNDENKCQTLQNGDGVIMIFMLNKYE